MANILTDARRKEIWEGLSEVFVDNEPLYNFMAVQVGDTDIGTLEEIFFNEVAPVCAFNMNVFGVIPSVCWGFSPNDLEEWIHEMQARNRRSWIARVKHRIAVSFYRWRFAGDWNQIVTELEKRRSPTTNEEKR
jgi:hypothetical protein